ncbi:hypothetical protein BT96DRAFT_459822 [Gymnopus androsaceus JB14]|uniref:Uncharacterized protein n=1 Tax=Gymnopus androsaceus JB14 TaxID=1447944 RepID=A0A6A4IGU3_9AGAR|nr:hypothetical protein BT96DRAFT_459822 [Gymnopus androsaceus JB14]
MSLVGNLVAARLLLVNEITSVYLVSVSERMVSSLGNIGTTRLAVLLRTSLDSILHFPVTWNSAGTLFSARIPFQTTCLICAVLLKKQPRSTAPLGRAMSTRSLGLRAEVPHGVDTARSFIAFMMNRLPASASPASTITLFEEFVDGLESGPQAASTLITLYPISAPRKMLFRSTIAFVQSL